MGFLPRYALLRRHLVILWLVVFCSLPVWAETWFTEVPIQSRIWVFRRNLVAQDTLNDLSLYFPSVRSRYISNTNLLVEGREPDLSKALEFLSSRDQPVLVDLSIGLYSANKKGLGTGFIWPEQGQGPLRIGEKGPGRSFSGTRSMLVEFLLSQKDLIPIQTHWGRMRDSGSLEFQVLADGVPLLFKIEVSDEPDLDMPPCLELSVGAKTKGQTKSMVTKKLPIKLLDYTVHPIRCRWLPEAEDPSRELIILVEAQGTLPGWSSHLKRDQ